MRPIPEEILEKVLETRQTIANNADPKMKIILRRGFNSELFQVYTIEEAEDLTDLDVAASRPETTSLPAKLYAFTVKDGIANVKSKNLPYDEIEPWEDGIDISIGVSSVAIEFDGYWERDVQTKRFNLVTDEYPWLFYVRNGDLYGQNWLDNYIILATNVVKVCAIRGWVPVAGDTTNDQGLIVAYLKTDGTVWYKNYCIQVNGEKDWEIEREVTEFSDVADDISMFRTNDFRVGFVAEVNGDIESVVTDRNYAGMSYFPELLTGQFGGFTTIDLIEVEHSDLFAADEHLTGSYGTLCIGLNQESDVVGTCTGAEITGDSELTLEFSQPLVGNISRIKDLITVSNEDMTVYYTPISTEVGETQNELVITVAELLDTENAVKVTVGDATIYLAPNGVGSMLPMAPFYVTASLVKDPYHLVNLTGKFNMTTITLTEVFYSDTANQEVASLTGKFNGFTSIILTKVGTGDI